MRQAGGRLQSQIDADNKLKRIQKLNGTWTGGKGVENLLATLIVGGFQMQEELRCVRSKPTKRDQDGIRKLELRRAKDRET